MGRLDPEVVRATLEWCALDPSDDQRQKVPVEGVVRNFSLHRGRLAAKRRLIEEMLSELPLEFRRSGGDGWSFLNACMDRHGGQWTGLRQIMEELFVLGIGIGKVEFKVPRELWPALPGGMPYLVIDM